MTRYWVEVKEDILATKVGDKCTSMWQQGPFLKYLFVVAHLFWDGFVFSAEESSTPQTPSEDLPPLFQDVSFQFLAFGICHLTVVQI